MIHGTAQKRWGEIASCTYRVGVELAEAHCAGFNEDVEGCSVPSSAGYMVLGGGEVQEGGMCVWKRRQHERRGELSTSAAPRWRWRTNSAAIQSVPGVVPEYLHHSSQVDAHCTIARQALPRSPASWRKH